MGLPKVSIGLCVKNAESTIGKAIEGILRQDYPHKLIEIIIVDGCSKDNTIPIIKKILSNKNISYKIFYEDQGLGNARDIALQNSSGKYILWVDSDVILSPNYIRKHVNFMEKNPKVCVASGKFSFTQEKGIIAKLENIDWVVGDYIKRKTHSTDPAKICCAGSICRVRLLRQVKGFDRKIIGAGEDIDLAYKLKAAGWLIHFGIDAKLQHIGKGKLKSLWDENFWYGYGGHYVTHRYKNVRLRHSFIKDIIRRTLLAYFLTGSKITFLLPIIYSLKKVAWLFGFIRAHIDGYGHA